MDVDPALAWLIALPVAVFLIWFGLLPLWMYNRVRGIERAMWAIVTQLQHIDRHQSVTAPPPLPGITREVPKPAGHISTSMFGR